MALSNVNILPEIGLYNGAMGTVIEIVYKNRPVGPNDKEHCHLPDYVVVDFLNLKLLPDIPPWDTNHKTVSLLTLFALLLVHISRSKQHKEKCLDFFKFGKNPDIFFTHSGFFGVWKKSRNCFHSPRNCPTHVQHVPITMITKLCKRKHTCCKVTYCPLVPAWATTDNYT